MKKCISLLTSICLIFAICVPAAGAVSPAEETNTTIRIINHSDMSEESLEQVKENVTATMVTAEGEYIPVECIVTIENLTENSVSARRTDGQTYSIMASATSKPAKGEDSIDRNGIVAHAVLIMMWTDQPGYKNTIDELSGFIDVTQGTISSGFLQYGATQNQMPTDANIELGTNTYFCYDINYTSNSLFGSLYARHTTNFTNGTRFQVSVKN